MSKTTNQFDMASLIQKDIQSIDHKSGVRETISNVANGISQTVHMVTDIIELTRYELLDMKIESRKRLLDKYNEEEAK